MANRRGASCGRSVRRRPPTATRFTGQFEGNFFRTLENCFKFRKLIAVFNSLPARPPVSLFELEAVRRKIYKQRFNYAFLVHGDSPFRHRAGAAIIPSRHDWFASPQRDSVVGSRRQIVRCPETPRLRPEFTHHEVAYDQPGPIEISVVAQLGTSYGELRKKRLLGS